MRQHGNHQVKLLTQFDVSSDVDTQRRIWEGTLLRARQAGNEVRVRAALGKIGALDQNSKDAS